MGTKNSKLYEIIQNKTLFTVYVHYLKGRYITFVNICKQNS